MIHVLNRLWAAARLERKRFLVCLAAVPVSWYLVLLSGPEFPAQQWVWIEAIFIPLGVVMSADPFVGRYERCELELLLARWSARSLYAYLVLPCMAAVVIGSILLSLEAGTGGALEAMARACLVLGVTHLTMILTRSLWFGIVVLSLWWFVGLVYMSDWAASSWMVAMWHPMRLSGGGVVDKCLEFLVLTVGIGLLIASWFSVGKDDRWVN